MMTSMRSVWNNTLTRIEEWLLHRAGTNGALSAGIKYINKGNFEAAAETFADAERLFGEQAATLGVGAAMAYRAWCYVKLNRASEAVLLYEDAIELERQGGASPERIAQLRGQLEWANTKRNSGS